MKWDNVWLTSTGIYLPQEVLKTSEIEEKLQIIYELLNIKLGKLELLSGVKERRIEKFLSIDQMATLACKFALKNLQNDEKIDCIVFCGVCKEIVEPSTALLIANNLGFSQKIITFDIASACAGFSAGLITVANMIQCGQIKNGLIVAAENVYPSLVKATEILNIKDINKDELRKKYFQFSANLLSGSGAVAYLLSSTTATSIVSNCYKLVGGYSESFPQHSDLCVGKSMYEPFLTNAMELKKAGCSYASSVWQKTLSILNWKSEEINYIALHQLGSIHTKDILKEFGIDIDEKNKHIININYNLLGNIGAVSVPLNTISAIYRGNKKIIMTSIGSGINYVFLGLELDGTHVTSRSRL